MEIIHANLKIIAPPEEEVLCCNIGLAIETEAKNNGLTVIKNLGSHGIGSALHEEPDFIVGHYDKKDRRVLRENQVITIEPFISSGTHEAFDGGDGWTLKTQKGIFTA